MERTFEWENRTKLVHEVANQLRERIYSGQLAPGDHLRQVHISNTLKVSRTPVREAFRVLEQEGLVTQTAGGAVRVVCVCRDELLDAYALREVIDGLAAREASKNAGHDALKKLLKLIDEQRKSIDPWMPQDYTRLNVQFHSTILKLAANKFLSREVPLVRMTSQVFTPSSMLKRDRAAKAIVEHGAILEAIRGGEGVRAEALAREHIRTTIKYLEGQGHPQGNLD